MSARSADEQAIGRPGAARWGAILWPAFVGAAVTDAIVFTVVDPSHVPWLDRAHLSPLAAYTLGFLVFWAVIAASSAVSLWMISSPSSAASARSMAREP